MDEPRFPNESAEYRKARNELLEAEVALRRQLENVATLRRSLPFPSAGRSKRTTCSTSWCRAE
jgi:predicted dithiol-disulfide oxidoreductase (DUF899 family)